MKNIKLISFLFAIVCYTNANAQLKVLNNGNVGIGTPSPQCLLNLKSNIPQLRFEESDYSNKRWHIEGYNAGLSFVETDIAERMRINPGGTLAIDGRVGINGYISSNYNLYVTGHCRANSWSTYSDSTAKNEIKDIDFSERIKELRPVQFKWKEEKQKLQTTDSENTVENVNRVHYGFLAQEVLNIFPDIVTKEENGELNMNYDALIPMLVDCYKKMDKRIETMEKVITEQEKEILTLKSAIKIKGLKSDSNESFEKEILQAQGILYQNIPNPFTESTVIKYYVSENVNSATLYIYNMQGIQMKSIMLNHSGEAEVIISGSQLRAGMYLYTLIADGKEIDTKRMILTE